MPKTSPITVILLLMTSPAAAAPSSVAPVPDFGATHTAPGASERPDPKLRYRIVFSISKASARPDQANPGLEKVARFLNLLAESHVRPRRGDVVAVLHGPATLSALSGEAYSARTGGAVNPNGKLIAQLRAAGVIVSVCSQALHAQNIPTADLAEGIRVDVSALTTVTTLQLRGYAVVFD